MKKHLYYKYFGWEVKKKSRAFWSSKEVHARLTMKKLIFALVIIIPFLLLRSRKNAIKASLRAKVENKAIKSKDDLRKSILAPNEPHKRGFKRKSEAGRPIWANNTVRL